MEPRKEPVLLEPEVIIEQLRALAGQIPEFGHLPDVTRKAMRGTLGAHPAFVQAAIVAVGASAVVREAVGRSAEEMRRDAEAAARWSAVEAEARSLLQGIVAANLARRHRVGLAALQTYTISRQMVRRDDAHSDLLPHVEEMRRLNRFGRYRARKSDTPQPQSAGPVPR